MKIKYFLTVHYFVVIISTFPYCAYINIVDFQNILQKTCLSCQKLNVKIIYFLIVHYFVVIISTFPYCAYINIFNSHYNRILYKKITGLYVYMYIYTSIYNICIYDIHIYIYAYVYIYI